MHVEGDFFETVAPQEGFLLAGAEKLKFVSSLFDKISPTYNFVNHLISLGQTSLWRYLAFVRETLVSFVSNLQNNRILNEAYMVTYLRPAHVCLL